MTLFDTMCSTFFKSVCFLCAVLCYAVLCCAVQPLRACAGTAATFGSGVKAVRWEMRNIKGMDWADELQPKRQISFIRRSGHGFKCVP